MHKLQVKYTEYSILKGYTLYEIDEAKNIQRLCVSIQLYYNKRFNKITKEDINPHDKVNIMI